MTPASLIRTLPIVNRTRWHRWVLLVLVVCTLAVGPAARATAQQSHDSTPASSPADTSFTYRGQLLRLGEPVSDLVDFEFTLWDAAEGGTRIGGPQWAIGAYVRDGLFSVSLDFGPDAFGPSARWLQISVISARDTEPVTLVPRQRIAVTPVGGPYVLRSQEVAQAAVPAPGNISAGTRQEPGSGGHDALGGSSSSGGGFAGSGDAVTGVRPPVGDGDDQQEPTAGPWQQNGNDIYYDLGNVGIGTSTPANPLQVETATANATAMVGWARGPGSNLGVYGLANGATGTGIFGLAKAESTGTNFGGRFESRSTAGRGVYGIASAHSGGQSYGGWFQSNSTQGRGIQGYASAGTGRNYGGLFQADGDEGYGVYGYASNAGSKTTFGGYFLSKSTKGRGIFGYADASVGVTFGVLGQSNSTRGRGVQGVATATQGGNYGVYGQSDSNEGYGVYGYNSSTTGYTYGVFGQAASSSGRGVLGYNSSTTGGTYGVYGLSDSGNGIGVYGYNSSTTGITYGLFGRSDSSSGRGVFGYNSSTTGYTYGLFGQAASSSGRGVLGYNSSTTGGTIGVYGQSDSNAGYGVYGYTAAASGDYALFGYGNSGVTGVKKFHIDHPDDPANQYLDHYSAEGPEPYLLYRGNVLLDDAGEAWVELPDYFETINRDYHYQLTPIGAPGPNLYVADEIAHNRFHIAGGTPGGKVSWTVTGIRNDPWVRTHPIRDAYEKPAEERGTYLRPELYGQPEDRALISPVRELPSRTSDTLVGGTPE